MLAVSSSTFVSYISEIGGFTLVGGASSSQCIGTNVVRHIGQYVMNVRRLLRALHRLSHSLPCEERSNL